MKKFIFIIMLVFPVLLQSQNFEPNQRKFFLPITNDSVFLSGELPYFQQTQFVKGVHWDYSPRLGRVLGMSQQDIYDIYTKDKLKDSSLLHIKPFNLYTHCQGPEVFNARGIQYSPTLLIDTNNISVLQTREGDSTNPIFGFAHIRGRITNNPADTNYSKLIIDGDSLINQVILEEPWTVNELHFTGNYANPTTNPVGFLNEKNYLCRGMYITINLRRDDLSNVLDTMPVLKLEIPHTYISQILDDDETIYYADGGNL